MAIYQYLDNQNSSNDGAILGQAAASKVAFWGKTPVDQPAATAQSAITTTTITSIGSTSLTALDLTRLNALIDRVEAIRVYVAQVRTDLVEIGIQKGSI
jgi:hypothetical protein